jgi:hypothetical protein
MFRISVCVCAFLLLACFALPIAAQQPVAPPVTGTGTANHITKWITTTKLGNSGIFENASGDVGIGTTSPVAPLDLNGTGDIRDTLTLFPKASHPVLSVSGTVFAVSHTGKVTFVSGQTFPGAGTVTNIASGAGLTGGPITTTGTLSIATGGVTNAMLAHPSLTVTANSPLSGGGSVALGGSTSLGLANCAANQILQFISGAWKCSNAGSGTVTSVGSGAGLTGGPITTSGSLSIASGGVTNAMLANPSLTVKAGTGLSGGGAVSLGSSVTLNNAGILGVGVSAGITTSGSQNPTLGIDTSVVPELAISNFFSVPQFIDPGFLDTVNGDATALYAFNNSTISTNPALYVENDDSTDAGDLALDVQGPNFGGECSIDVTGNLFCTGVLGAAVKGQGNNKKIGLYTMQSSEDWIEDFGSGALNGGVATIRLEQRFAKTISGQANYHVFLTPAGDCDGLYIANRTATSFEVRELKSGTSSVSFDYRIVAHRKGFESARLPDVTGRFISKPLRPPVPSESRVRK